MNSGWQSVAPGLVPNPVPALLPRRPGPKVLVTLLCQQPSSGRSVEERPTKLVKAQRYNTSGDEGNLPTITVVANIPPLPVGCPDLLSLLGVWYEGTTAVFFSDKKSQHGAGRLLYLVKVVQVRFCAAFSRAKTQVGYSNPENTFATFTN